MARKRSRLRALVACVAAASLTITWRLLRSAPVAPAARAPSAPRVAHAPEAAALLPSKRKRATRDVPRHAQRTFFAQPSNGRMATTLLGLGWRRAERWQDAELLWYQKKTLIDWDRVKPWQLVNHVRAEKHIGSKADLHHRLEGTPAAAWTPETYDLKDANARATFVDLATREAPRAAGEKPRWLLKDPIVDGGNGIEILDAGADALDAAGGLLPDHRKKLAQRYVSDLLLLDGHKFDLRVYWVVASFAPPLVYYYDGTLRVSLSNFTADGPRDKSADLTNAAQQKGGHSSHDERSRQAMSALWALLARRAPDFPAWPADAAGHVKCEIRRAIQEIWKPYAKVLRPQGPDAFVLFGADFMIDEKLGVHLSEIQSGPGLPTNTKAVREVVEAMIPDFAAVVLAVRDEPDAAHATAKAVAQQRGFELLVDGAAAPAPASCEGRRASWLEERQELTMR
jgi:hypothetical protein